MEELEECDRGEGSELDLGVKGSRTSLGRDGVMRGGERRLGRGRGENGQRDRCIKREGGERDGWQWNKGEHINRYFFKGNSSCGNVNKLWHFPARGKKPATWNA